MPKRNEKFAPLHLSLSPTLFSRMMSESSSFSYIRYMKKKKVWKKPNCQCTAGRPRGLVLSSFSGKNVHVKKNLRIMHRSKASCLAHQTTVSTHGDVCMPKIRLDFNDTARSRNVASSDNLRYAAGWRKARWRRRHVAEIPRLFHVKLFREASSWTLDRSEL